MHQNEIPFTPRVPRAAIRKSYASPGSKFISDHVPKHPEIPCHKYSILHQSYGCPARCAYCYLVGILQKKTFPTYYTNFDRMVQDVETWMAQHKSPAILNAGALSDSFSTSMQWLKHIAPLFAEQDKHTLVLVTKGWNAKCTDMPWELRWLTERYTWQQRSKILVVYSLNAPDVTMMYESGTPMLKDRLEQSFELWRSGWRMRFRIDPMIPVPSWKEQYRLLAWQLGELAGSRSALQDDGDLHGDPKFWKAFPYPERITLGALRGTKSLITLCDERKWPYELDEDSKLEDGKLRIAGAVRARMFQHMQFHLRKALPSIPVALCKEPVELCKSFSKRLECVCVP